MAAFDLDLKERVRSAVDIVDVIGQTNEVLPQGRNFVTRCPWHDDRRPSMTINQERQSWKCWVCDIGGDVFSYVMMRDGAAFPDAMRTLADLAGIPIEDNFQGRKTKPGDPDDRETLLKAIESVAADHVQRLSSTDDADAGLARAYLESRGISKAMQSKFRLGFSADSWDTAINHLRKAGFSREVAVACGAATAKKTGDGCVDMFRGRLMFPIADLQGRVIALGGRVIPAIAERDERSGGGKYINGRETQLFRKSSTLYGLPIARDAIRKSGEAFVMEGYTDVIAAHQCGIESAVAVLGTALTGEHVKVLRRFAPRVVLVLDGDDVGRRRADEVLPLFIGSDIDLRIMTLPMGMDPADFLSEKGVDAFQALSAAAPDAFQHKMNRLTDGVNLSVDTHAVTTAIDELLSLIAGDREASEIKVDRLLDRMADTFGIRSNRLEQRLKELKRRRPRRPATRPVDSKTTAVPSPQPPVPPKPVKLPPLEGLDLHLFEALVESPDLVGEAVEVLEASWFSSSTAQMLLSAYQALELEGGELDSNSLLVFVENQSLKNAIVGLQQRVEDRQENRVDSADVRYADVVQRYRDQSVKGQIDSIASSIMDESAEEQALRELFEQQRVQDEALRERQNRVD